MTRLIAGHGTARVTALDGETLRELLTTSWDGAAPATLRAVVDRTGLQVGDGRHQGGQPPLGAVPPQRLGACRHAEPGQVHDPAARRVRVDVQGAGPDTGSGTPP